MRSGGRGLSSDVRTAAGTEKTLFLVFLHKLRFDSLECGAGGHQVLDHRPSGSRFRYTDTECYIIDHLRLQHYLLQVRWPKFIR